MCEIIMERSLNELWDCDQGTGEIVTCGFRGDGGCSEFSDYYCEDHDEYFDTWAEALEHKQSVKEQ